MAEDLRRLLSGIRDFGWNPTKRESNLLDHKIDFEDVRVVLDNFTFIRRSDRHGEIRYQVFGYIQGRKIAVACALRGTLFWVISARPARRDERQKYYNRIEGHTDTRQD